MAAAGNNTCDLDIQLPGPRFCSYSLPTSATVMEVKRRIMSDSGCDERRLNLYVLPQGTMMEDGKTLASSQIRAGERRSLFVDIAKITVLAAFIGDLNKAYPVRCYEWDTVMDLKMLILGELRKDGVRDVGADDMELSSDAGGKFTDLGAPLSRYGVNHQSWIFVKNSKEDLLIRGRPTSGL